MVVTAWVSWETTNIVVRKAGDESLIGSLAPFKAIGNHIDSLYLPQQQMAIVLRI